MQRHAGRDAQSTAGPRRNLPDEQRTSNWPRFHSKAPLLSGARDQDKNAAATNRSPQPNQAGRPSPAILVRVARAAPQSRTAGRNWWVPADYFHLPTDHPGHHTSGSPRHTPRGVVGAILTMRAASGGWPDFQWTP